MIKKRKLYKPAKMVNWFSPKMLLMTGIKSVISSQFGNYADRREMEAALNQDLKEDWSELKKHYSEEDELWVDFVSDTGDGFNSTYSVANLISKDQLTIIEKGGEKNLLRGKILLLGGDQIYPAPTSEIYEQKFKIPFSTALPGKAVDKQKAPHMYAIPGNHDWYDGLGNFIKIFCQQRNIGAWITKQRRSYFAIPLPYDYWIWGTDIQLNADIDQPQMDYFENVASHMADGTKLILVTAEPSWIYGEIYADDKSYDRLTYFIDSYIKKGDTNKINKKFILKAILTGDLHHYSHYTATHPHALAPHLIGAGGGGAFMHLTHNLPDNLHYPKITKTESQNKPKDIQYAKLKKVFPEKKTSKRLNLNNILFPFLNLMFCAFLSFVYLFFYWVLESQSYHGNHFNKFISEPGSHFLFQTLKAVGSLPTLCIISIFIIIGFKRFTDTRSGRMWAILVGWIHAVLQCFMIFFVIGLVTRISIYILDDRNPPLFLYFVQIVSVIIAGWLTSGFIMGIYLYATHNKPLKMHLDEASSALSWNGYKNFLRMRFDINGVTIYPIGIRKVTKWDVHDKEGHLNIKGESAKYELIEEPIIII
jgi:hypothetical protein